MKKLIVFLFAVIFLISCSSKNDTTLNNNKIIGAYLPGWYGEVNINDIDPIKLTHIFYAFANLDSNYKMVLGFDVDSINFSRLNQLKKNNPNLKIILSIGGWGWSDYFSDMANQESNRKIFISSAVKILDKYKLDGIDLDWEYPGLPGEGNVYRKEDGVNFALLVKEMRMAFDALKKKNNQEYYITAATGGFKEAIDAIDFKSAIPYMDLINVMSYDLHNGWDSTSGHHANMYKGNKDMKNYSGDSAVRQHIRAGVPPEKILLGVAFYGRAWAGVAQNTSNGLLVPAKTGGTGIAWDSITKLYATGKYQRFWDDQAKAAYAWNSKDSIFISYDDTSSIDAKAEYVKNNNLGGLFFWEIKQDAKGILLNRIQKVKNPR